MEVEQQEKEDKQAHLYTIIVARDEDLVEQIGRDMYFDLVDHDKVGSFRIQNQTPFSLFKEEVAKEFSVPVQHQRFWIWVTRQNNTYLPDQPLTAQEEAQSVGQLTRNMELKLFLEVEFGLRQYQNKNSALTCVDEEDDTTISLSPILLASPPMPTSAVASTQGLTGSNSQLTPTPQSIDKFISLPQPTDKTARTISISKLEDIGIISLDDVNAFFQSLSSDTPASSVPAVSASPISSRVSLTEKFKTLPACASKVIKAKDNLALKETLKTTLDQNLKSSITHFTVKKAETVQAEQEIQVLKSKLKAAKKKKETLVTEIKELHKRSILDKKELDGLNKEMPKDEEEVRLGKRKRKQ